MIIKEERGNRAVVWDNYKAGVIDTVTGKVIIPIRYDEIAWRIRSFSSPGPGIPPKPCEMAGFACFTDEGEAVAYDFDGNVDSWKDWEEGHLNLTPEPRPKQSLASVEKKIITRYYKGYDKRSEREKLEDLLRLRCRILNYDWEHTPENAKRISAVNDRLNAAVREALRLGEEAENLIKGSCSDWMVEVEVYPEWEDPEDGSAIQNIIAELGRRPGYKTSPCFSWWTSADRNDGWDFKTATLDDGVSWDEGAFRRPAYQDCYFLHPFQELYFDNYILAFSDLLSIKNFYINVMINKADR